jgi:hypothetical protein
MAPTGVNGIMYDFDESRVGTAGSEFPAEGLADGQDLPRCAKGPSVELVIQAGFQVGPGVAVVKGNPGCCRLHSRSPQKEVRFDSVSLYNVRAEAIHERRHPLCGGRVKCTCFPYHLDGDSAAASRPDKQIVRISANECRYHSLDAE